MNGGMSAIGTKRTWAIALHMSAFGGKADIAICMQMSAFDPKRTFHRRGALRRPENSAARPVEHSRL